MPEKEKCNSGEKSRSDCGCGCLGTVGAGVGKKTTPADDKAKK